MTSGQGRVELRDLSVRFGATTAVDDLSLCVEPGELLVIVGPSGCGKSTVLRTIAGLEQPDAGTVAIDGHPVGGVRPADRDVAMVFQNYALYPHLSVRDNIAFPLRCRGVRAKERARRVDEVVSSLDLGPLSGRKPAQLSGGERQRVALARAIVRRPAVFLMDEPLSNLDGPLRSRARAELVGLQRGLAATVLFVTHDQVEAMTMADRVAVMRDGRIQQVGPAEALYDCPANLFVAGFLGSPAMNFLPGRVEPNGGHPSLVLPTGRLPLPRGWPEGLDRTIVFGLRPEDLSIAPGPICAVVLAVESLGHERIVLCDAGGEQPLAVRSPSARRPVRVGARVELRVEPGRGHLFDNSTGRRVGSP